MVMIWVLDNSKSNSVNWVVIGSFNGLVPVRRQNININNDGLLLLGYFGTNLSEFQTKVKEMILKWIENDV